MTLPSLTALVLLACAALPAAEPAAAPLTIGAYAVAVAIPKAPVAGKPLDVDLTLVPATPAPKAVRLWVGKADARGAVKVKAEPEAPGAYCVGVEVPDPLPAEAQVWIAIEAADGTVAKAGVPLKATAK